MTYEAPKMATLVDDFRNEQVDNLKWVTTGSVSNSPLDTSLGMRGLLVNASGSVGARNDLYGSGVRRLDFFDSEIVWVIGSWNAGTGLHTLAIENQILTYGYRFEYNSGVLVVKSIEGGVTYTGANFLDGTGATVNWAGTLHYFRIAHSASTGKVEFYAGRNPDGSDQRLMSSDLGTGAKGTLTAVQGDIDNMSVRMVTAAGAAPMYIRAVNAPAGGLPREGDDPAAYYHRDFSTWQGYTSTQFHNTNSTMSHELYTLRTMTGGGLSLSELSPVSKVMRMVGDGGSLGRTAVRTGFTTGIQDVNLEFTMTSLAFPDTTNSYHGVFWRNSRGGNILTNIFNDRYQLNIFKNTMRIDVFVDNNATFSGAYADGGSFITLFSKDVVTNIGQTYDYRINHYGDNIIVIRDGEEIIRFTDVFGYIQSPGHIGFDVGSVSPGSASQSVCAIHEVKVSNAYDDQSFASGVAMQHRDLGAYVRKGRRDLIPVPMATDPGIVGELEDSTGMRFKAIYHYTNTSAGATPGTAAVDTNVINAARAQVNLGRTTNVICLNAFRPTAGTINDASYQSAMQDWVAALNTIGGSVYVAILPFADLNVPWSPLSYTEYCEIDTASTTNITQNSIVYTVNALVGKRIRFQSAAGLTYFSTVTSNTADSIDFVSVGATPATTLGSKVWINNTTANSIDSFAEYRQTFQDMVTYMRSLGCRASFVFAMNWTSDAATLLTADGAGQADTLLFDNLYPGDAYVDSFLIRAINYGVQNTAPTNYGRRMFRSLSSMLTGERAVNNDLTYPALPGSSIYDKMHSQAPSKKMFLITGCVETHNQYSNFSAGFNGENIISTLVDDESDVIDTTFLTTSARYWTASGPSSVEYNPKSDRSVSQYGIEFNNSTTATNYATFTYPIVDVNKYSASVYFRLETLGVANAASEIVGIYTLSTALVAIRVDQNTGNVYVVSNTTGYPGTLIGTIVVNKWYRAEVMWFGDSYTYSWKQITYPNSDGPDPGIVPVAAAAGTANHASFGTRKSNFTSPIQGLAQMQEPRATWDHPSSTFSKARWLEEALNLRSFSQVSCLMLFSSDAVKDIPINTTPAPIVYSGYNHVDTRLDASKYTLARLKDVVTNPNPDRVHTAPQLRQAGYVPSSSVGSLEYMYLKETGHVPLQLAPRIGGVLLRDFNLGQASVRVSSEDRPGADGVRDYSKFLGAKGVSLSFVTFDDPSGSAAFYSDVIGTWANPRRRPVLVYKFKDGEERFINLRPEGSEAAWTTDGVRAGFKEVQLSFVGVDGKDFTTNVNTVLLQPSQTTRISTNGSAATPPKIRIYGGSSGCMNPTIVLQSLEEVQGTSSARVSLGSLTSPIKVPANQYLELDMHERTIQLNGLPGKGNSYLQYLSNRQWFYLETYYNTLYFWTDDGVGYAAVYYNDSYL